MKALLISLIIAYLMAPASYATVYEGVVPSNVTAGEDFIVFVKIVDSTSKIITDPISTVSAKYSGSTTSMLPLDSIYSAFPETSDYWATTSDFSAGSANYANVSANYIDTQLGSVAESKIANVTVGVLTIVFTGSTDFLMTKNIGENISFVAYLKDFSTTPYIPPIAKISYLAYDLKKMEVFDGPKNFVQCTVDETKLCASHTITAEHPAGILSFYASNGTDVGGRNIYFQAIPYEVSPSVNVSHPRPGDVVEFSLNPSNVYGQLSEIYASVTLPDETVLPLYLNNGNGYKDTVIAPNMSGDYVFNATVNHTIKGITEHISAFRIHTAYFDVKTSKNAYKQGEDVAVTIAVYDSNGTALEITANATIITSRGANTYYSNSSIAFSGNIRSFIQNLALDATEGEYGLAVDAEDLFGRKYFRKISFHVNTLNKTLTALPSHIANAFESIENTTYTINLLSNSTSTINNIYVSTSSEISEYVVINVSDMSTSLLPNTSTSFRLTIIPEDSLDYIVSGKLFVNFDGNLLIIPVIIENELSATFYVNPSLNIELLSGVEQEIKINIKNDGNRTMHGFDIDFSSDISSYVSNSDLPDSIAVGETETVSFDLKINYAGTYSGTITFIGPKGANAPVTLSIEVFNDFSSSLSALDSIRKTLNLRILALEANGKDVSHLSSSITALQGGISEVNSFYENGLYKQAKSTMSLLQANANTIQSALDTLESATPGTEPNGIENDGVCESDELCSSVDCIGDERCTTSNGESNAMTIIIVVLAVIIILIVLATSIMPDEKKNETIPI